MSNFEKKKFYRADWFMWVMFIFFAPLGIILLWVNKESKYSNKAKTMITAIWPVLFIVLTVLIGTVQPTTPKDSEPTVAQQDQSKEETKNEESDVAKNEQNKEDVKSDKSEETPQAQIKEEKKSDDEVAKLQEKIEADKNNKVEIKAKLQGILASYDILSLDILTLNAGGNSASIQIISDVSKANELAQEVANKIKEVIAVYDINIINKKSQITATISN